MLSMKRSSISFKNHSAKTKSKTNSKAKNDRLELIELIEYVESMREKARKAYLKRKLEKLTLKQLEQLISKDP